LARRVLHSLARAECGAGGSTALASLMGIFFLDLLSHQFEGFLDPSCAFGRGLEERHLELVGELLAVLSLDFAVFFVVLVANEDLADTGCRVLVNFLHPVMDRFKTFLVSHIIGNYDTLGASVVASRQISEPLLTGSVPDLKLNDLIIHFHCFEFEVHANGVEKVLIE